DKKLTTYLFACLAVFFLLISHSISLLYFHDKHMYFGYVPSNVYHNPTILLLKPIALLSFYLLYKTLQSPSNCRWSMVLIVGIITGLAILAKPSYIIVLLPALLI